MQELLRTGIYFGKLEINLPIHQALFSGLELLLGLQLAASQQAQFQCPHGLELLRIGRWYCIIFYSVSMSSRAYTSFLQHGSLVVNERQVEVSMPSRAYTSFLQESCALKPFGISIKFQCPLGLIPHFYGTPSKT